MNKHVCKPATLPHTGTLVTSAIARHSVGSKFFACRTTTITSFSSPLLLIISFSKVKFHFRQNLLHLHTNNNTTECNLRMTAVSASLEWQEWQRTLPPDDVRRWYWWHTVPAANYALVVRAAADSWRERWRANLRTPLFMRQNDYVRAVMYGITLPPFDVFDAAVRYEFPVNDDGLGAASAFDDSWESDAGADALPFDEYDDREFYGDDDIRSQFYDSVPDTDGADAAAPSAVGGHDAERLVERPANIDDLTCSICLDVQRDASLITACGHSFCHSCIAEVFKSQRKCPTCRSEAKHFDPVADMRNRRCIDQLQIRCDQAGCGWTGRVDRLASHLSEAHVPHSR